MNPVIKQGVSQFLNQNQESTQIGQVSSGHIYYVNSVALYSPTINMIDSAISEERFTTCNFYNLCVIDGRY